MTATSRTGIRVETNWESEAEFLLLSAEDPAWQG